MGKHYGIKLGSNQKTKVRCVEKRTSGVQKRDGDYVKKKTQRKFLPKPTDPG